MALSWCQIVGTANVVTKRKKSGYRLNSRLLPHHEYDGATTAAGAVPRAGTAFSTIR